MRAHERYLGTRDIMYILGVGRTKANEIMHMFEFRGLMYRVGRKMMVKEKVFQDWLKYECKTDGFKYAIGG